MFLPDVTDVSIVQPVGEGLFFADAPNLTKLYVTPTKAKTV
jgi:hypothetical protein